MRRGLMAWDADELPLRALELRVARLQAAMAAAGQDAMLLYTNFIRSAAVSYLTAFSPYWADGVLLVPRAGEPVFATTLSKRVGTWIATVKPVGGLVTSPTPGKVLSERLAAMPAIRRIAILERDAFPAGLYDSIAGAFPDAEIVDGSDVFAQIRAQSDDAERALFAKADAIARRALDGEETRTALTVGEAAGAAEKRARLDGAEEIYVAIAPDLDADRRFLRLSGARPLGGRHAVRATVAYKGVWVRRIRTYARDAEDAAFIRRADAWFAALAAAIDTKRPLEPQIRSAVAQLPGAHLVDWIAEAPFGTHPLQMIASSATPAAATPQVAASVLTIRLVVDAMRWCGAALAGLPQ